MDKTMRVLRILIEGLYSDVPRLHIPSVRRLLNAFLHVLSMRGSVMTACFLGQMADAGYYRAFLMGMASFLFKGCLVWGLSRRRRALESRLPKQWMDIKI